MTDPAQTQTDSLVIAFEQRRGRLHTIAYRMLGSLSDADDVVQEVWLRLSGSDVEAIENLDAWLTTVCGRVCLNILRSRGRHHEESYGLQVPDPVVQDLPQSGPEAEAILAESVGLALLVVVDSLAPPERIAFVLHDMFAIPFEEIAAILERTPESVRQLASRARRRVQGQANIPNGDLRAQREVVDAYLDAGREGNFERLVALLDPDVVLVGDSGPGLESLRLKGSAVVARAALAGARAGNTLRRVLVNGNPGAIVVAADGQLVTVLAFTVVSGRIAEIDAVRDPERLRRLRL
jgi:RNA polymerase sigma-70 factor (ECF subfamily)